MKALDIVKTPGGGLAVVTETNRGGTQISIDFLNNMNPAREHNAWWSESELEVLDSIPRILANAMCNGFGTIPGDFWPGSRVPPPSPAVVIGAHTSILPCAFQPVRESPRLTGSAIPP